MRQLKLRCASLLFILLIGSSAPAGQTQCRVEDRGVHADEKAVYELLTRCGGTCNVNYDGHLLNVFARKPVPAECFRALKSCTQIESLWLGGDDGVLALAELGKLQNLTLSGTAITDKALEAFANGPLQKSIRSLNLDHTAVTDAGLKYLAGATGLQSLNVMHTRISDVGLVHLRGLKSLAHLAVDGTALTLDGIAGLKPHLPRLGNVYLSARQASGERPAGGEKPAAARPLVKLRLKNGKTVEGLLLRFADGIYTVKQAESLAEIRDADIEEITFVSPPSSPGGKGRLRDRLTFLSQSRSVQDLIDAYYAAGPKAGAEMAELLTDSDPQVRRMAAQAISNWDMWGRAALPRELQAPLIKALRDENPQVRRLIPGPLARLGESSADVIAPLAEALTKEPDGQVAGAVIQALHRLAWRHGADDPGLKAIVDALSHAATDHPETQVRVQAIGLLGSLGERGQEATEALRRLSDDRDSQVREAASKARNQVGVTLRQALRKLGADEQTTAGLVSISTGRVGVGASPEVKRRRREAEKWLKVDGEKNLPFLMEAVRLDDEDSHWQQLAQIIGAWGEPALPAVAKYGDDPHPRVRRTVALALGDMRPNKLPEALCTLLGDREESVRESAVCALCRITGHAPFTHREESSPEVIKAAVPLLVEVLANPRLPVDRSDVILWTLGRIGPEHPAVVPALLKTLKESGSPRQRDIAISALGSLAIRLRSDEELKPVLQALIDVLESDSEAVVRMRAAAFLGALGVRGRPALAALKKAEDDADPAVAREARQAVTRIAGIGEDDTSEHKARRPEEKMRPRLERKGAEPRPEPPKPSQPAPDPFS